MTVLIDDHRKKYGDCNCSYCSGENDLHYGLNIPPQWFSWNAWYIIKYGNKKYFRFTPVPKWFSALYKTLNRI